MAFEVTEHNASALEPLFNPWEEPMQYRMPNPMGGPALIEPGRRPSKCPLVRSIRAQVDGWRRGGYAGVSETSRYLMNHWFMTEHKITDEDGNDIPFRYHWAQREAIETIIYLYEMRNIRNVAELMFEFGDDTIADLALGVNPEEDRWEKNCCKIATGGGKTKVMSLAIVWSYFHSLYESGSDMPQHFVIIAPNLTVYERLKDDFEDCAIFYKDPLLPEEWKPDFQQQMQVVLQDKPGGASTKGAIYLTNIHRLYEKQGNGNGNDSKVSSIFGPDVKHAQALHTGEALRDRITNHPTLMVFNDEAHHLHDPDLAWNRAVDALHNQSISKGNSGIHLQLDFTATPKHNNGDLFRHIICDFPLGEAVDAGIVKVPVIGESDQLVVSSDKKIPGHQRYAMHLKLGYERYQMSFEQFSKVRKPILFVMTEDARAANEIADYLDSDQFPMLKGKVLNIHTRLKGRIKKVMRGGREIKEFVENETTMKPDHLRELREMSRELDKKDSKFRCIVSVMMLREGWDVRNVTTIVPLRPYSSKSGILPEQTLGRGLRRMAPFSETPEVVTVVHHPAFRKLYEEELAQEGLDIAILPIRESLKESVSIFVDHEDKPVEDLEIEIPLVTDAVETTAELQGLTIEDVREYFHQHFGPLPVGKKKKGPVEYKERHLFTDEIVSRMRLDAGLLTNAWSAPQYFAQMLGRGCRLHNPHKTLTPLIEKFLSDILFEREIDLFSGEADHRMRDVDVIEHVKACFTPLILERTVHKKDRKRISQGQRLSTWRPYQATSNDKRPAVPGQRTMFNLVPCDNEFEQAFADFCDFAADVEAFAKNAGPQKLMIDYLSPEGNRSLYVPDFFVRISNEMYFLVELKGKTDTLVPLKAKSAREWCKASTRDKLKWQYLYVPYHLFQQSSASSLEELSRACEPSLNALVKEAETRQMELPFKEASAEKESNKLFSSVCQKAGISNFIESSVKETARQAIQLLDYAVKAKMPTLSHAFQPFLRLLDDYAIRILSNNLIPGIPKEENERYNFFNPYLNNLPFKDRIHLEKNERYLQHNLVFGRSIQKLGTLLFCLDYAQQGRKNLSGIWKVVKEKFSGNEMKELFQELSDVNTFRNIHVAHVEAALDDPDKAWEAMILWIKCVNRMASIAYTD